MDKEKIFVDGMKFERPKEGSPEWVKGRISVLADKLVPFIQTYKNEKGWLNIQLKQGREGALYLELDTWQPNKTEDAPMFSASPEKGNWVDADGPDPANIPF